MHEIQKYSRIYNSLESIIAERRIFPQTIPLSSAQDSDLRSIGQVKSRRKVWQTRRRTRSSAGVSWLGGISFPRRLPANATLPPYRGRRRRRRRRRFVFLRSLLPVPVPVPASPCSPPSFPTLFPRSTSSPLNTSRPELHAALPLSLRRSLFYFRSFPTPSTSGIHHSPPSSPPLTTLLPLTSPKITPISAARISSSLQALPLDDDPFFKRETAAN